MLGAKVVVDARAAVGSGGTFEEDEGLTAGGGLLDLLEELFGAPLREDPVLEGRG